MIGNSTDLSFPVYGWKGQRTYKTSFQYIPLVESPGVVFIVNTDSGQPAHQTAFDSSLRALPLIGFCLIMSLAAGIVIWALVSAPSVGEAVVFFVNTDNVQLI